MLATGLSRKLLSQGSIGGWLARLGVFTTGKVFFVQSTHASASNAGGNSGDDPESPFATIDYAVGRCTASKNDVIVVAPDHAEAVAAANGIDFDVAGITVIGLGNGTNRPTITMGTATTATCRINAASVRIKNLRFVNNIDSLVKFLNVAADDAAVEDCDFIGASTKEFLSGVNITTTIDNTTIRGCRFIQRTDPAGTNAAADTGAIFLVDSENVLVENCEFRGDFETAFVHNRTTGCANFWMRNCYGWGFTNTTDGVPFVFVSTATGGVERCSLINPNEAATTEATLSGTFPALVFNFQSFFGNDGSGGQNAIASQSAAS